MRCRTGSSENEPNKRRSMRARVRPPLPLPGSPSSGKRPPKGTKVDLPKPTELMKAREAPLELDKNLNKTIIVSGASGAGQPGFFCDVCNKTSKDSVAYLDHINSRARSSLSIPPSLASALFVADSCC